MNKKFLSGTVFGLVLGLGISFTVPMIGAPRATDIKLPSGSKSSASQNTSTAPVKTVGSASSDVYMKEMVNILKEIDNTIKQASSKESEQNERIIKGISDLNAKSGF